MNPLVTAAVSGASRIAAYCSYATDDDRPAARRGGRAQALAELRWSGDVVDRRRDRVAGPAGHDRGERGHDECAAAGHPREVVEPADHPERHGRPLMVRSKTSPSARLGLPAGSAVETMAGIGIGLRARGRGRRRTDEQARDAEPHRRTGHDLVVRLRVDRLEGTLARLPGAVDNAASRTTKPAATAPAPVTARGSSAGSSAAPDGGFDPVIGSDVGPGDLDLAAFDADLEDRREGPDRHGQRQDQERQVAGRWVAAECPQPEDRDEVAPAGAHPAQAADRQREEADDEQGRPPGR